MHALKSYDDLFHHFTSERPETTHLGILSIEEVAELKCQSRIEGQRAGSMESDHIKLANGDRVACNTETIII